MILLAIDQSAATGSAALLDGDRLLAEESWTDTQRARQRLFEALASLFSRTGIEPAGLSRVAVGMGPGSYSGLRVALTTARALALPGRIPVYALSSAETLAWQAAESEGAQAVRVVGDARRGQWWTRRFERAPPGMRAGGGWDRVPAGAVPADAPLVVTPDGDRIGALLRAALPPSVRVAEGPQWVRAAELGRLAGRRMAAGIPSDPLEPLYLHPAVAPPPRSGLGSDRHALRGAAARTPG